MGKSKVVGVVILAIMCIAVMTSLSIAAQGRLRVAGSTTVLPLAQIWLEEFAKKTGVDVSVSGGGTGTGISMLLNGTCDIANASRPAKKKEIDAAKERNVELVATKLAKDGVTIIVHPSNNVKNLTMEQLAAIYSGKCRNWKNVGGESDKAIVVVGRDSNSGTYGFFQEVVLGGDLYRKDMLTLASNAAVTQAVAQSEAAIGYVGMAFAEEAEKSGKVRCVSISHKKGEPGVKATEETVRNEKYPLFRYLYAYTLGKPKGLAAKYLSFALSEEGQKLVAKAGFVPLK